MSEEIARLEGQLPLPIADTQLPTTALLKWQQETGAALIQLSEMFKQPTDHRPFVYDIRVDLMATSQSVGKVVLKGFGENGGLVAFHDCVGLVDGVRALVGRMKSGKLNWYEDQYIGRAYEEKRELYLSGVVYKL